MALVRGSNPVWSYVDLTGHQFDDTFYMFVLENTIPYIPATVWHDPNGNIEWTSPIRFFANGTLPIDIYWDPDVVYRLEFRQGNTQADPLIYLVENYQPGGSGSSPIQDTGFITDNQLANPQFARYNLPNPVTYTSISAQTISIAPGWDLVLSGGTGNVTLTRQALNSSSENPTNAPYSLQIQLSGSWDAPVYLRQRLFQNGMLWASHDPEDSFVSCSVTALISGTPQSISAILKDSLGNTLTTVLGLTTLTPAYQEYVGHGLMPETIDTDTPPNAYIDFLVEIPTNVNMRITSLQLIASNVAVDYPYEQTTIPRQVAQTYYYDYPVVPIGTVIDFFGFNDPEHFLLANGQEISRQTYSQLFNTITKVETVTLTIGLNTFTVADGSIYAAGTPLEGTGITASPFTFITNITGNVVTMSAVATANGPHAVRFFTAGNGNGPTLATTFNVPNLMGYVLAGAGVPEYGPLLASTGVGTKSIDTTDSITLTGPELPVGTPYNPSAGVTNTLVSSSGAILVPSNTLGNVWQFGVATPFSVSTIQPTCLAKKYIRFE